MRRDHDTEVDSPFAWLNAGIGLIIDCVKALFKFRKPDDAAKMDFSINGSFGL